MDISRIVTMAVDSLANRLNINPSRIVPSNVEKDPDTWRVYLFVTSGSIRTKYLAIVDPIDGRIGRIEKVEDALSKPPGERSETDLNKMKRTFTQEQLDDLKKDYTEEISGYEKILNDDGETPQERINAAYVSGKMYRELGVIFGSPSYLQKSINSFKAVLDYPDTMISEIRGKVLNYLGLASFKLGEIMLDEEEMNTAVSFFERSALFFRTHQMMPEYEAVNENLHNAVKRIYGKDYKKALSQLQKSWA